MPTLPSSKQSAQCFSVSLNKSPNLVTFVLLTHLWKVVGRLKYSAFLALQGMTLKLSPGNNFGADRPQAQLCPYKCQDFLGTSMHSSRPCSAAGSDSSKLGATSAWWSFCFGQFLQTPGFFFNFRKNFTFLVQTTASLWVQVSQIFTSSTAQDISKVSKGANCLLIASCLELKNAPLQASKCVKLFGRGTCLLFNQILNDDTN